jgi:IS5 family transposase
MKIIHSVVVTAANIADCAVLPELLHGEETKVWGDQAYRGQGEVIREAAPLAQDMTNKRYRYKIRRCCLIHLKNSSTCQRCLYICAMVSAGSAKFLVRNFRRLPVSASK